MSHIKYSVLSLFAVLILAAVPAQAATIDDIIGNVSMNPVDVDIDTVVDAVNVNGTLHVVGHDANGVDVRQLIDLTTGVTSAVEVFVPQNGNANPSGGEVGISQVIALDDGRALYVGESNNAVTGTSATYWFDPENPNLAGSGPAAFGSVRSASTDGTIVGTDIGLAAIGSLNQSLQPLPGNVGGGAVDITTDASYIVGDSIWQLVNGAYQQVNTLGFDVPTNSLGLPTDWASVAIDPVVGDAVFGAYFLDALTFTENFGFWRADGTFLFAANAGERFSDFEVYDGQLVAALNGLDDGILYALTDGSSLTIESITGDKSRFEGRGLYQGSAGFVLRGANGVMTTTYLVNGEGAEVPEPSTLILGLSGLLLGGLKRRSLKKAS